MSVILVCFPSLKQVAVLRICLSIFFPSIYERPPHIYQRQAHPLITLIQILIRHLTATQETPEETAFR